MWEDAIMQELEVQDEGECMCDWCDCPFPRHVEVTGVTAPLHGMSVCGKDVGERWRKMI